MQKNADVQEKNSLCFYYFHRVYAIYALNNVNVHVKYVKDT